LDRSFIFVVDTLDDGFQSATGEVRRAVGPHAVVRKHDVRHGYTAQQRWQRTARRVEYIFRIGIVRPHGVVRLQRVRIVAARSSGV